MDWKFIFSLSPDNLTEDDKDQLYSSIAWFDFDSERLDNKKCIALLKLSQEIMKYKAEQVEALLAELDEVAARQGEEEARKQDTDDDLQSLKSKKSQNSVNYEEVEQKYRDLKSKLKQQIKINESQKRDLDKIKQTNVVLEEEKSHLHNELQSFLNRGDDTQSDISESITDQQKELLQAVQKKNKLISQLLSDVEETEKENLSLKEKMSNLRDELSDATNSVSLMTNDLTSLKIQLNDSMDTINSMKEENEALQSQIQDLVEEKQQRDNEIDEFAVEIDTRVDKWKSILQDKDEEIQKLKSRVQQTSSNSSETTVSVNEEKSYVEALNKAIIERDDQLIELQAQLQSATKEMETSTQLLKQLSAEKKSALHKIDELSKIIKGLKTQLNAAHKRSQELLEDVSYAESIAEDKQEYLNDIVNKLKNDGKIELSDCLQEIQKLKMLIRTKEKDISGSNKIINKLQASYDEVENENSLLRAKCGIEEDEDVATGDTLIRKRAQSKNLAKLHKQIRELEEQNFGLKIEMQKTSRKSSDSTDHNVIADTGIQSPEIVTSKPTKECSSKKSPNGVRIKELTEENEALRKGLHEILESVKLRNENSKREIKSETLEKLLHALDLRHVSGWYHPAMRLQAELHTLKGINTELREQLKASRLEQQSNKQNDENQTNADLKIPYVSVQNISASTKEMILDLNEHLSKVLSSYHNEENINGLLVNKLEEYKKHFEIFEQQLNLLYNQYHEEKQVWKNKEQSLQEDKNKTEDDLAVLEVKLKEFSSTNEDEFKKLERLAEMSANMTILNRKCVYLENQETKLSEEVSKLKNDLAEAEITTFEKISNLRAKNDDFLRKLIEQENSLATYIDRQTLTETQNNLDSLTLKYRELLNGFNTLKEDRANDLVILNESIRLLEQQKSELQNNLANAMTKEHIQEVVLANNDIENLSKKLAQSEISEIAEKQRADHMSSLYKLVKDQLQKSEQRFIEYQKQNQDTLQKNLVFQENVKDLENKLLNYVDINAYKELEVKHANCSGHLQKLTMENKRLENEVLVIKKSLVTQNSPRNSKDLEILNLKHQILDLQATGDDKALIARLSSDVVLARLSETQFQKKMENLELELKEYQNNCDTLRDMLEQTKTEKQRSNEQLRQKLSILEQIVRQQRQQYFGSLTLSSEEVLVSNLQQIMKDKQLTFKALQKILLQENESTLLKEQLNKQVQLAEEFRMNLEECPENIIEKLRSLHKGQKLMQLKELKLNREIDFKNMQLKQLSYRLNTQDDLIMKLQEELLQYYNKFDFFPLAEEKGAEFEEIKPAVTYTETKLLKEQEIQTSPELIQSLYEEESTATIVSNLQNELVKVEDAAKEKDNTMEQLKSKITELEMNISLFRTQIGDKQSQITFYEKHILELQNKMTKMCSESITTEFNNALVPSNTDEIVLLKEALQKLKDTNLQKDNDVLKYQTLLKQDRDEHSLAAARMQQEVKRMQDIIATQDKAYKQLKESSIQHPGKAAIEQYIHQVHALEKHTAELHTTVSSLNSQLQASRQEAVRWQTLANERLDSMEELRTEIEEQHQNEIVSYKRDCERWREEILKLKQILSKHRSDSSQEDTDLSLMLKEKNDKINELTSALKTNEKYKSHPERLESTSSPKLTEPVNEQFPNKEYQILKRQYEQIIVRERNAKDEIHKLKEQLLKRPISARSDKSEKEQLLQKKITTLEKENADLKEKLEKQAVINEAHRITVSEDFEKWKKQKYWQQTSEKLKTKLNEKSEEFDKLNQTCASYKILIERLEKEKHSLENKIKTLRANSTTPDMAQLEMLKIENERLHFEIETLNDKLQMQHHHSGGLGAAMLQDKLQAQERKIAVLELTSKSSTEIRNELDHLQSTVTNLQKLNLRLESENLELKLDLEKFGNDAPHLREQIHHLERYIEVLKSENQNMHLMAEPDDQTAKKVDSKKITELERTVFVLKRVVEKLQVENKRLQGGSRPCTMSDRPASQDIRHLKDQYAESVQKISRLENQLKLSNSKITSLEKRSLSAELSSLSNELSQVKSELSHKSLLLDKVKVLLHRAATKEKALLDEITELKTSQSSVIHPMENVLD